MAGDRVSARLRHHPRLTAHVHPSPPRTATRQASTCSFIPAGMERTATVARYTIIGYEEYPALNLHPVDDDRGVQLPPQLYGRWLQARTALDTVQRDVIAHLRASGGRIAIPGDLWELLEHTEAALPEGDGIRAQATGAMSDRHRL